MPCAMVFKSPVLGDWCRWQALGEAAAGRCTGLPAGVLHHHHRHTSCPPTRPRLPPTHPGWRARAGRHPPGGARRQKCRTAGPGGRAGRKTPPGVRCTQRAGPASDEGGWAVSVRHDRRLACRRQAALKPRTARKAALPAGRQMPLRACGVSTRARSTARSPRRGSRLARAWVGSFQSTGCVLRSRQQGSGLVEWPVQALASGCGGRRCAGGAAAAAARQLSRPPRTLLMAQLISSRPCSARTNMPGPRGFVRVAPGGAGLALDDGRPFSFAGANCYYLLVRLGRAEAGWLASSRNRPALPPLPPPPGARWLVTACLLQTRSAPPTSAPFADARCRPRPAPRVHQRAGRCSGGRAERRALLGICRRRAVERAAGALRPG